MHVIRRPEGHSTSWIGQIVDDLKWLTGFEMFAPIPAFSLPYHPCFTVTSPLLHRYFTVTSPLLHRYFTAISPSLQRCFTVTSRLLHGYFNPLHFLHYLLYPLYSPLLYGYFTVYCTAISVSWHFYSYLIERYIKNEVEQPRWIWVHRAFDYQAQKPSKYFGVRRTRRRWRSHFYWLSLA